jgi:hypothetical protein
MTFKSFARRIDPRPPTRAALPAMPVPGGEWVRLRRHATIRIEESLDHIPTVLHRLGLFLLIGSFAMVAFCIAVVIVLIHAVA